MDCHALMLELTCERGRGVVIAGDGVAEAVVIPCQSAHADAADAQKVNRMSFSVAHLCYHFNDLVYNVFGSVRTGEFADVVSHLRLRFRLVEELE